MSTFIISDTHFGHFNILRYCARPFNSVNQMDDTLINNWINKVKSEDTVWHLGDFALAKIERVRELLSILPGHKNLVMGNHDRLGQSKYRAAGFETVIPFHKDYSKYIEPEIDGVKVRLCHYPGYLNQPGSSKPYPLPTLYGHTHQKPNELGPGFHQICVEHTNYSPISLEEALQL